MITIYHGVRPSLPQAVCHARLNRLGPADLPWDWRENPLRVAGKDTAGDTVCCLAHGRHQGLYRRALAGVTALFGVAVSWVDVDALRWREMDRDLSGFLTLMLFNYFPWLPGERFRRSIDEWIAAQVLTGQEERR